MKVASQTPAIRSGQRIIFLTLDDATGPGRGHGVRVGPAEGREDRVPRLRDGGVGAAAAHRREGREYHRRGGLGPHRAAPRAGRGTLARGHGHRTPHAEPAAARRAGSGMRARAPRGDRHGRTRPPEPILHVDLDAFYASRRGPEGPVARAASRSIVGGTGARGVVAARLLRGPASTGCARRCRRSARGGSVPTASSSRPTSRPTARTRTGSARSCCSYTPLVEPISLDEAFLDVGGRHDAVRRPRPRSPAKIRADVEREVGVTCSVGRRADEVRGEARLRRLQARTGCSWSRPSGVLAFLEPLPVGRLWGVGEKTGEIARPARRSARSATWAGRPSPILERLLGERVGASPLPSSRTASTTAT